MAANTISRRFPDRRLMQKFLAERVSTVVRRLRAIRKSTQEWGQGRPHEQRVHAAYRCVLDRAAEPRGLAHWEGFLTRGGSFDELLQSFLRSVEFRSRLNAQGLRGGPGEQQPGLADVQAAYRCLMGREADPEGLAHWLAFLRSGGSFQELLIRFIRAPEFMRRLDEPPSPRQVAITPASTVDELPPVEEAQVPLAPPGALDEPLSIEPLSIEPLSIEAQVPVAPPVVVDEPLSIEAPVPASPAAAGSVVPQEIVSASKRNKFAVIGNCQSISMMRCVQALTGCEMPTLRWTRPDLILHNDAVRASVVELFGVHEKVFVQPAYWNALSQLNPEFEDRIILYPAVAFAAYHPDVVYVSHKQTGHHVLGPCHDYQSSIAFLGWLAGLSAAQTLGLFNSEVFRRLGFFDSWRPSMTALIEEGRAAGIELEGLANSWRRSGSFMRSMNHPKLLVNLDIARVILEKHGIPTFCFDLKSYVYDWLSVGAVWPVYPEIGEGLGVGGHYLFKLESPHLVPDQPLRTLSLKEYVDESFAVFSRHAKEDLVCERMQAGRYQRMLSELLAPPADRIVPEKKPPDVSSSGEETNCAAATVPLKFAVLGNGQAGGMARCLQALVGGPFPSEEHVTAERLAEWESGRTSLAPLLDAHDKIFMQPWIWNVLSQRYAEFKDKVVLYPSVAFTAYHPDVVDIQLRDDATVSIEGPMGKCHSSLTFLAWNAGLSVAETVDLFRRDVLKQLGSFDYWRSSEVALLEEGRAAELPLETLLGRWKAQGCFMHQPVHPKLFVIADIARVLLERLGIPSLPFEFTGFVHDHLADDVAWPVYPELGEVLGCPGSFEFKQRRRGPVEAPALYVLRLEAFVEQSFAVYSAYQPDELVCRRLEWPNYLDLSLQVKNFRASRAAEPSSRSSEAPLESTPAKASNADASRSEHPYSGLPDHRFWRKAIQNVSPAQVDPVVRTKFKIGPDTKVATAGSCFALNISRRLIARGYNFLQAEPGLEGSTSSVEGVGGMGLFSARFGYLYTARQLRQLMERAYGRFAPDDKAWTQDTGGYVDPFRPRVEPDGFISVAALERSRADHLAAVRRMFESLDVFVFTLGLTEAWRAKSDGAVFSVAPGVAGGQMDFGRYEFVNFTVAEVDADLQAFIQELQNVNPRARLILTVSPVPIIATYEDRHVLVASTYTKSVLRVAAEQIAQRNACCDYFPGYELVNGSYHRGSYIAEDLRSVTSEGVDHVMRLFFDHYAGDGEAARLDAEAPAVDIKMPGLEVELLAEARKNVRTVCDEELLEAALR